MLQKVQNSRYPETGTRYPGPRVPKGRGHESTGVGKTTEIRTEHLAPRIQTERDPNEMAIACQVQSKMFPQRLPPLETLDYAASCEQAWTIGGDYYDFLEMGGGRVGFVLADVSGNGIPAALLMANLQASLRSQFTLALEDLPGLLRAVNKRFHESAASGRFATLFFADYSDATRKLRYVSCGHNPAFLVHVSGLCEMLEATATVLGLFKDWDCSVAEAAMAPGDVLVVYSDGVSEAQSESGEMFGDKRLLASVRANAGLPAAGLLKAIAGAAHKFGGRVQEDDLTLLVARAR